MNCRVTTCRYPADWAQTSPFFNVRAARAPKKSYHLALLVLLIMALRVMPKNVAIFDKLTMQELIARAPDVGYDVANPESGLVHCFPATGGFSTLRENEIDSFIKEGNGILLWRRGTSECVYVCLVSGRPQMSFGGLSKPEEVALTRSLREHDLQFRLVRKG